MLNVGWTGAKLISHWHSERSVLKLKLVSGNFKKWITDYLDKIWYEYLLIRNNVVIVTVSNYSASVHKNNVIFKLRGRIRTLLNSIPVEEGRLPKMSRCLEMKQAKLVSVGRLSPEKNHEFLLDVIVLLREKSNFKFFLHIYGNGILMKPLQEKIKELRLEEVVELKGNVSDVLSVLNSYDLFVHSAKKELFGLSLLEAMISGLPLVALNNEAIGELVIEGESGFLVNNKNDFAHAILRLVNDPPLYHEMSVNAVKASERYSFADYMVQLDLIYNSD